MAGLEKIKVAVTSDNVVLRDPKTRQRLTTAGLVVEKNPFWIRRIKCGDCVLVETYGSQNSQDSNEGEVI